MKIVLIGIAIAITMSLVFLTFRYPVIFLGCDDTVVASVPSPDKKYVVTIFHRDCGATSEIATQVNVQLKYSGKFNPNNGRVVIILEGSHMVSAEWQSNSAVKFIYPYEDVFRNDSSWGEISINHQNAKE